jgi:RNA polymerase sigma factor (sigma-70 family)
VDAVTDLVGAWATAPLPDRPQLLDKIVMAARSVAAQAAKQLRLQPQDSADVEQHATVELVKHLELGKPFRRTAEAFIWTVAERRALDLKRKRKREAKRDELVRGENELAPTPRTPLEFLLDEQTNERVKAIVAEVLEKAPDNYRRVVRRRFFDGLLIEEIAEEYYADRVAAGEVDVSNPHDVSAKRDLARGLVDRHWYLAKAWLKKQLEKRLEEIDS